MHEAILYEKIDGHKVLCRLCRHGCTIKPGKRGICGVRENREGTLYTLVYGRVAAQGVDPIEKKPFFHFNPGSMAFSIATMGCNFHCAHCQNSSLSKTPADTGRIEGKGASPETLVDTALSRGCESMSYTYSEPTVYAELAIDCARTAKERGLYNTFVTNGYQSSELIQELDGLVDAANIDLKGFSREFYKKICGAELDGVLDTIARMHGMGIWIEITTLLIPGLNDSAEELKELAGFIAGIDQRIPWHISRFHPCHRMTDRPATPIDRIEQARGIGREAGLRYVYTGNVPGDPGESTYCHACNKRIIHRYGFMVHEISLVNGRCMECGAKAAGRFHDTGRKK